MRERDVLMTDLDEEARCVACNKTKECLYLESADGSFKGWVCKTHLWPLARLRFANQPRPDRATPLFDGDRQAVSA